MSSSTRGLARNRETLALLAEAEFTLRYDAWVGRRWGAYASGTASVPLDPKRFFVVESNDVNREYHTTNPGVAGELGIIFKLGL